MKATSVNSLADLRQLFMSYRRTPPEARLGRILVEEAFIDRSQLQAALHRQQVNGRRQLGQVLVDMGLLSQAEINMALAKKLGIPYVRLQDFEVPGELLSRLPAQVALQYNVVPLGELAGKLVVAMENPLDKSVVDALRFNTNANIEAVMASSQDIGNLLHRYYSKFDENAALEDLQLDSASVGESGEGARYAMEQQAQRKPIVRLLNTLLAQGVSRGASDINVRPERDRVSVFYRVDGKLQHSRSLHKSLLPALVSRIKIISQLDIAERRLPQDGHARLVWGQRHIDLRISVVPTVNGESVVIRILDKESGLRPLDQLGLEEANLARVRRVIARPHGLFLVTGPTGAGKSTTLYALLNEVKKRNVHILTVEDPVEYDMEGVEQVQVSQVKGYTFPHALRHFLRHDPDVIMVGEIRDEETARIANKAALTGHLVFSTLHTNDAASAVTRLADMGLERYLLSSTLLGVMAQRLVRLNCSHCRAAEEVDPPVRQALQVGESEVFYRGQGCEACHGTGYQGRTTVCEFLVVTPQLAELINAAAPTQRLADAARDQEMASLTESALALARAGRTSLEEVFNIRLET